MSGTWFRHVPAGADAHLRPPHPADNRWQRGEVVDALYFADSEETVWAEWYRFLAEAGLPPKQGLPRDLWRWKIELPEVADLGDEDRLARVGLPPLRPDAAAVAGLPGGRRAALRGRLAGPRQRLGGAAGGPDAVRVPDRQRVAGTWPVRPPITVADPPVVPTGMRT